MTQTISAEIWMGRFGLALLWIPIFLMSMLFGAIKGAFDAGGNWIISSHKIWKGMH